jgi:hypothetical protein
MTLRKLADGTFVDIDEADIGPDGVLRDGGRLRVPMMFRDANRDAARRNGGNDDDDDEPVHRRTVVVRDPMGREMATISHDGLRTGDASPKAPFGSRPSFITNDDVEKIRREAYEASKAELRDAWRGPSPPAGAASHDSAGRPTHAPPRTMADAQRIRDAAYAEFVRDLDYRTAGK